MIFRCQVFDCGALWLDLRFCMIRLWPLRKCCGPFLGPKARKSWIEIGGMKG